MTADAPPAVYLVDYDPAWPSRFLSERALLAELLNPWLAGPIEHIGSTAVPGLRAKPVIDIMLAVRDLPSSLPALEALTHLEYVYSPYRAEVMHWLCKPSPARRTHHLHLVPVNSPLWAERVAFRDYLRAHAEAAGDYAELKTRLAEQYRSDREAYTEAKGPFIEQIVALALAELARPRTVT